MDKEGGVGGGVEGGGGGSGSLLTDDQARDISQQVMRVMPEPPSSNSISTPEGADNNNIAPGDQPLAEDPAKRIAALKAEIADLEAANPNDVAIAAKQAELEALQSAAAGTVAEGESGAGRGGRRRSKRRHAKKSAKKSKKGSARKSKKVGRSRKNGSKRRAHRKH